MQYTIFPVDITFIIFDDPPYCTFEAGVTSKLNTTSRYPKDDSKKITPSTRVEPNIKKTEAKLKKKKCTHQEHSRVSGGSLRIKENEVVIHIYLFNIHAVFLASGRSEGCSLGCGGRTATEIDTWSRGLCA